MRRSSPYYNLKYRVDCRWPNNAVWEPIAAFNAHTVAVQYAVDCYKAKGVSSGWSYRVMERKGNIWVLTNLMALDTL